MNFRCYFIFIFILAPAIIYGQSTSEYNMSVLWYNVENLFDTISSPNTNDEDFTPTGKFKWNSKKYSDKLDKLAQVISSCKKESFPGLVGLCEIENVSVLKDLINNPLLKNSGYKIIHEDSPDERGIDVAFLYQPIEFEYEMHKTIRVVIDSNDFTRDILYVKGKIKGESVHCFMNHWPSRRGGEESNLKRVKAAYTLRQQIDSIFKLNKASKIIIMGDLNDEPQDMSVFVSLEANNISGNLFNLCLENDKNGLGTHFFKDGWNMLDNFIVSPALLPGNKGLALKNTNAQIFSPEWLTWFDVKNQIAVPSRTYAGDKYVGGYSDHFALVVEFIFN